MSLGDGHREHGIDRPAVDSNFEVEMRLGGAAGSPDLADPAAGDHDVASLGLDFSQVAVERHDASAVIDLDAVTVAAVVTGVADDSIASREHGRARIGAKIGAAMKPLGVADRIIAPTKSPELSSVGHWLRRDDR